MLKKLIKKFGKFQFLLIALGVSLLLGCLVFSPILHHWFEDLSNVTAFVCSAIGVLILFFPFMVAILLYNETPTKNERKWLKIAAIIISAILSIGVFCIYVMETLWVAVMISLGNYETLLDNGTANYLSGDNEKAIENLEKAIELHHDSALAPNVYILLGHLYEKRDCNTAIEYYEKAISAKSEYANRNIKANVYNNLGYVYAEKQDYDKAIESFEKSIELDSGYAGTYSNMGYVYAKKQDYETAEKFYRIAIDLQDYYVVAYSNMAYIYEMRQDYDKAIEYYSKADEFYSVYLEKIFDSGFDYIKIREQGIQVPRRKLGEFESDLETIYSKLENLYLEKGDAKRAAEYKKKLDTVIDNRRQWGF